MRHVRSMGTNPNAVCTLESQSGVILAVLKHLKCYHLFGDRLNQRSQTGHLWNEDLWFLSYCKHSEISFQHLKNENSLKSSFLGFLVCFS